MKVLIYGGGAVGLGIASCLLKSRVALDIIARENTVQALRKNGLSRTGIFGDFCAEAEKFSCYASISDSGKGCYDFILVCTKSFDSAAAAQDLAEHRELFGENARIVLFQNGWGNAEKFLPFFDKRQIYSARVITGFTRAKDNEAAITVHADSIHIGSLFGGDLSCIEKLCEAIDKGDIPCEETEHIEKDLWAKMLYNCALNGLGAILNVPYGVLGEYEFTRKIMKGITEEVFVVMKSSGYETYWQRPNDFLDVFYEKLLPDTAEHKSSTLQDIIAGKKTEIDALNGAVIKLAKDCNIEVPYNSVVYNIIKFIESQNA